MIYFKVNSSRDTTAGLFRAGMVYGVANSDHKTLKAINPHLEKGGPFKKLTAKQVTKEIEVAAVRIGPATEGAEGDDDTAIAAQEAAEKRTSAEQAVEEAQKKLDAIPDGDADREAAVAALEAAKTALAELAE